ncbi:MAG: ABC transporter ATP-binding protein [Proteobacteria bacterium]|nr:ABC transporter ATP-binding protein [Pseudomonadota bacterium]
MARIEIEDLSKSYGTDGAAAVKALSLTVEDKRFVTLLGPSGCGKTTTLRLIAGYLAPDGGSIRIGGEVYSAPGRVLPPERRGMGMVFQNYAVWPHKTVYENVVFGLQVRRVPAALARERVMRLLDLVKLGGLERRYPNELSGGQQQRVALARSLVVEPEILLLDEPLSNLDAKLRERMRVELKELQRRLGITFVYVTHDQAEALALSDEIAVMHQGELQQFGSPRDIYMRPANRLVADFMGLVNLVPGRVVAARADGGIVAIGEAAHVIVSLPPGISAGRAVELAIRPENIKLRALAAAGGSPAAAQIAELTFLGNLNEYQIALGDALRLRVQTHPLQVFAVGDRVAVEFDGAQCTVFA